MIPESSVRLSTFRAPRALAFVLAACALFAVPAAAQDSIVVRLRAQYETQRSPGFVVLPIAGGAGAEIAAILRQDLQFSDRFEMAEATGYRAGQPLDLRAWSDRGADWVLEGSLSGTTLRLSLHDAVYGQKKGEGTFTVPAAGARNFRMAVHAASDAVVRWATGEPGMAASRIAYVVQGRGSKEIYVVDSDGENATRITSEGTISLSPSWSPDGSRIAYTSFRSGAPLLYERNLSTGGDRVLSDRGGINITPSYAPDGRTVAFGTTVGGHTEIATVGPEGLRQHTRGRGYENLSPSFSPDGRRLAFVSDRLGQPQIYVMSLGGEPRLISEYGNRGYSTSPDWSPAGPVIAYHTRINGRMQVVAVDVDGGRPRVLTTGATSEDPSWAPDGRHLVFASPDRDGGGLFVLDTVTGRIRPLLRGRGFGLPDWSPALMRADGRSNSSAAGR
jgi:TolB protein